MIKPIITACAILSLSSLFLSCKKETPTENPTPSTENIVRQYLTQNKTLQRELQSLKKSDPKLHTYLSEKLQTLPLETLAGIYYKPKVPKTWRQPNSTQRAQKAAETYLTLVLPNSPPETVLPQLYELLQKEPAWAFSNSTPKLYLREGKLNNTNPENSWSWTIPLGNQKNIAEAIPELVKNQTPEEGTKTLITGLGIANKLLNGASGAGDAIQYIVGQFWAEKTLQALEENPTLAQSPEIQSLLLDYIDLANLTTPQEIDSIYLHMHLHQSSPLSALYSTLWLKTLEEIQTTGTIPNTPFDIPAYVIPNHPIALEDMHRTKNQAKKLLTTK